MLEMTIVVILIAVLVVVAANRLIALRIAAEKAAVERTVVTLRTVIVLELASRLIDGIDTTDLEGGNPMALWHKHVEYPLPRYVGERGGAAEAPEGSWFYQPKERVLVYRTLFPDAFHSDGPDPASVRFRMRVVYSADGRPAGVRLEPLDNFTWSAKDLAEIAVN